MAKPKQASAGSENRRAVMPGIVEASKLQRQTALMHEMAQRFGLTLGALVMPDHNPYDMPTAQALEIARRAGILTRTGKLKYPFK